MKGWCFIMNETNDDSCVLNLNFNNIHKNELPLKSIEVIEDFCIHVVDKEGRTIYYSKGCENVEGYRKKDVFGKHISELYRIDECTKLDTNNSMHLKVLKTGKAIKEKHMNYMVSGNKHIDIINSTYPIYFKNEIIGAISVFKDISELKQLSRSIVNLQNELINQKKLDNKNGTHYYFEDIIGSSDILTQTIETAKKICESHYPKLLIGETGTGKELFAQSMHNHSSVSDGPFVAVNCGAIPEQLLESILFGTTKGAFTGATDRPGLFEEAQNGTLFLDEINSMGLSLQTKLLRALETKKIRRIGSNKELLVNTRIISAANINPIEAIKKNKLRSDLYYRLAVLTLEIPPLRLRLDDIDELVTNFIEVNNKIMAKNIKGISNKALELLKNFNWPGNVRQLRHAMDYAMSIADSKDIFIEPNHLPQYIIENSKSKKIFNTYDKYQTGNLKRTLKEIEKKIITREIENSNNNYSQAARKLGISRQHLQYRLKILKIKK